jgi:hypothetical protein
MEDWLGSAHIVPVLLPAFVYEYIVFGPYQYHHEEPDFMSFKLNVHIDEEGKTP